MTQVHPIINIGLQYIRNTSEIHSEVTYTSTNSGVYALHLAAVCSISEAVSKEMRVTRIIRIHFPN